jgi:hypothetical protein
MVEGGTSCENRSMKDAMTQGSAGGSIRWIHEVTWEADVAFRTGKRGTELVAQWPGVGTLTCAPDGSCARFAPMAGAPERTVRKLERAQVRALLRDLAGQLAFHASAVVFEGRAVLFLGSSGAGKSTAAAEMCLHHGAYMLADDAAALDVGSGGVHVVPCEEDHWLTSESCLALGMANRPRKDSSYKCDLRASHVARQPSRLGLVVALRFDVSATAPVLRPVRGSDAGRVLLEASIRFDVEDGAARGRELEQLTTVYDSAPLLELVRPLHLPGGVAAFVIDALGRGKS